MIRKGKIPSKWDSKNQRVDALNVMHQFVMVGTMRWSPPLSSE